MFAVTVRVAVVAAAVAGANSIRMMQFEFGASTVPQLLS